MNKYFPRKRLLYLDDKNDGTKTSGVLLDKDTLSMGWKSRQGADTLPTWNVGPYRK